jgi:integrase
MVSLNQSRAPHLGEGFMKRAREEIWRFFRISPKVAQGLPVTARAKAAGFLTPVGCHTWRATGITIYLENDGRLEHAQQMAGHESPRTTKLYDRTKDEITLSEVERIRL